jgi:tripartite-type tricarboxylate transporter receptor subunit TctC
MKQEPCQNSKMRRIFVSSLLVLTATLITAIDQVWAQPFPVKPVKIVLSSPGGGTDIVARLFAENMSHSLGKPFSLEFRQPNVAAASFVAKAPEDGYVLLVATASYLMNGLMRQPQYDPIRDFSAISLLGITPIIIVTHPTLPVNSVQELVTLARMRPGDLNYGSGGIRSPLHLAGELFNQVAKVHIVHVPYKGTANASTDLQAGRMQVMFPSTISVLPLIKERKIKVLAIMSEHRSAEIPGTPTTSESGLPELVANIWYGMLAPAKTPSHIIEILNKEVLIAMRNSQVLERLRGAGVEPVGSTPKAFSDFALAELTKWKRVIDNAKIDVGQ